MSTRTIPTRQAKLIDTLFNYTPAEVHEALTSMLEGVAAPSMAKEKARTVGPCGCGDARCVFNNPDTQADQGVIAMVRALGGLRSSLKESTKEVTGLGQLSELLEKLAEKYECKKVQVDTSDTAKDSSASSPAPDTTQGLQELFAFTKQAQEDARKAPAQPAEDQAPVEEAIEDSDSPVLSNLGILVGDRTSKTRVFVQAGHDAYEVSNVVSAKLDFDGEIEYPVLTLKILCPQVVYPAQG